MFTMFNKNYQGPNDGEGGDLGGGKGADKGDDFDIDLDLDDEDLQKAAGDDDDDDDDADLDGFEDETDEEKEERLAADAKAEREKNIRIPKHRFDAEVGAARTRAERAEEEAEALRQQLAKVTKKEDQPVPTEAQVRSYIDQLQDQYEDLLVDGAKTEAREVRKKLDQAREFLTDLKVKTVSQVSQESTVGALQYDSTLERVEAAYPQLNPDHELFSKETASEVGDLMVTFTKAGMSKADALVKATKLVMKNVAAPPEKKKVVVEKEGLRQPKTLGAARTGIGEGGIPIGKLSQEAFNKLDEKTLAKARGDSL